MMEKKRIEEADRNVRQYITDGLLKTRDNETKKLTFLHGSSGEVSPNCSGDLRALNGYRG